MIKIKSIKFKDHDILGNLELDFCDKDGNPADTIIIAGENGIGKTTILEEIYKIMTYETRCPNLELKVICNNAKEYYLKNGIAIDDKQGLLEIKDILNNRDLNYQDMNFRNELNFDSIYSTVNINFSPDEKVKTIGATDLDINLDIKSIKFTNRKSNETTAINIKQLFVDIVNFDNNIIVDNLRQNIGKILTKEMLSSRIERFKNAFDFMFDDIKYKCIKNIDNSNVLFDMFLNDKDTKKYFEICFEKIGEEISIDDLSSGEKQIVFRGAFLLRNKNALNGAVVLIDEPEISMHPKWQEKILDYYLNLFVDDDKKQTSQIIISTHSNFVIENALKLDNSVIIALQENNQPKKITKSSNPFALPVTTSAEVNYHIFDILSSDYHMELYGYLQNLVNKTNSIKDFDKYLESNNSESKQYTHKNTTYDTLPTYIRNVIDHPDDLNSQNRREYTQEELKKSIEFLISLIRQERQNQQI